MVDDVADDSAQPAWAPVSVGGFDNAQPDAETAPQGDSARDAATEVALRFGVPRKGVYQLALEIAAGNADDAG